MKIILIEIQAHVWVDSLKLETWQRCFTCGPTWTTSLSDPHANFDLDTVTLNVNSLLKNILCLTNWATCKYLPPLGFVVSWCYSRCYFLVLVNKLSKIGRKDIIKFAWCTCIDCMHCYCCLNAATKKWTYLHQKMERYFHCKRKSACPCTQCIFFRIFSIIQ